VEISDIIGDAKTLEAALVSLSRARPPWKVVDVVAMDEYTHDVIIECRGRWAVIDAT